jgi:hypothetical protein
MTRILRSSGPDMFYTPFRDGPEVVIKLVVESMVYALLRKVGCTHCCEGFAISNAAEDWLYSLLRRVDTQLLRKCYVHCCEG